jgi:hypothetical protein
MNAETRIPKRIEFFIKSFIGSVFSGRLNHFMIPGTFPAKGFRYKDKTG